MNLSELAAAIAHEARRSARSARWRAVARAFLLQHPTCAACGSSRAVVAHAVVPVHVDASLELAASNLLALCRHDRFMLGGGGDYRAWNGAVRADAEDLRENPHLRQRIEARARVTRRHDRTRAALEPWTWRLSWHALLVVLWTPGLIRAAWDALMDEEV